MVTYNLYIVDDDEAIREGVTMALETVYRVESFATAEDALSAMKKGSPDLLLLDIGLPGMDGIEALRKVKNTWPDVLVVMITAFDDVDTVITTMKLGAYDYVVKPIHLDGLEVTIRNALQTIRMRKEVQLLQEKYLRESIPCFVGDSQRIKDIMDTVKMVAKSQDTPVLILGETGTGKELIASAIHYRSPNFSGPLVTVNCSTIPRDLIESELFGYEGGAFSGARSSGKRGLIEEAEGGTLFLDEVGDMSLEAQGKLLRFLEGGEYYRVGCPKKLKVQTRVVSATNKNLEGMIRQGLFRSDLYYRIGVVRIQVPSLNEHPDDIIPLARYFFVQFARKFGKTFTGIALETEEALRCFQWQGNIRELRNVIERGTLVSKGPYLTVQDLSLGTTSATEPLGRAAPGAGFPALPPDGIKLTEVLEQAERHYMDEALKLTAGNESRAAQLLGMNHHTFRYRRRKLLP